MAASPPELREMWLAIIAAMKATFQPWNLVLLALLQFLSRLK
jgi:hypothetical protein